MNEQNIHIMHIYLVLLPHKRIETISGLRGEV